MGREYELKYKLTEHAFGEIQREYGAFQKISMETVYYDTPDGSLHRRLWMLRLRMENGTPVCTLKIPLPDGSRGEWEVSCPDISDAPEKLVALGAPEVLLSLTEQGLIPICGARFTRLAKAIPAGSSTVELALDRGSLFAGENALPLLELEVELKAGSEQEAAAFAKALSETYTLTPESKSKVQRAMGLRK